MYQERVLTKVMSAPATSQRFSLDGFVLKSPGKRTRCLIINAINLNFENFVDCSGVEGICSVFERRSAHDTLSPYRSTLI